MKTSNITIYNKKYFLRNFIFIVFITIFLQTSIFSNVSGLDTIHPINLYHKVCKNITSDIPIQDQIKKNLIVHDFSNIKTCELVNNNIDLIIDLLFVMYSIDRDTDYSFYSVIEIGSEKIIFKVKNKKNEMFALGISLKSDFREENFKNEIYFISNLNHKNIVKIIESDIKLFYYVQPLANFDLIEYINKSKLDIYELLTIVKGISEGLSYLHYNNIVHRDVKPDNILLYRDESGGFIPVINDFSFAVAIPKNQKGSLQTKFKGSFRYISPQMLEKRIINNHSSYICTIKDDIYAFGVMLYEMFYKRSISFFFDEKYEKYKDKYQYNLFVAKLLNDGKRPLLYYPDFDKFDNFTFDDFTSVINIIDSCWKTNPSDRMTLDKVILIIDGMLSKFK